MALCAINGYSVRVSLMILLSSSDGFPSRRKMRVTNRYRQSCEGSRNEVFPAPEKYQSDCLSVFHCLPADQGTCLANQSQAGDGKSQSSSEETEPSYLPQTPGESWLVS